VVNFTTLQLYFQDRTSAPVEQETGWYPEPVRTLWEKESSFFLYWDLNSGPSSPQLSCHSAHASPARIPQEGSMKKKCHLLAERSNGNTVLTL